MDEIRKQFEAWAATLPDSVHANIADAMREPKCPSYTFEGYQAGYIAGQKSKGAALEAGKILRESMAGCTLHQGAVTARDNYDKVTK